jgi:hypothetical protein
MNHHASLRIGALAIFSALAFTIAGCKTANDAVARRGWRPLFDGKSTEGWKMTGPGEFKLENGELVSYGGMGIFWYAHQKFGDCRIRVVFQPTGARDNSGVFIRIPNPPADPWDAVHGGYEVQIENHGDRWHRTGGLYSINEVRKIVNARVNEWNEMIITLDGPRTIVMVNGQVTTDFTEGTPVPPKTQDYEPNRGPRPDFGYIGLQNHDDNGHVRFREVSVAPLRK